MEGDETESKEESFEGCIFCFIASGQDKEAEVVKQSRELVCFKDIYPAAPHHYLVVPTVHIDNCNCLHRGHIGLGQLLDGYCSQIMFPTVRRMAEMGRAVLHNQGVPDMSDIRLGFHQPPYTSVPHLHLHVLAPASQISEDLMFKFILDSERFITVERMLKCLQDIIPPEKILGCCMPFT